MTGPSSPAPGKLAAGAEAEAKPAVGDWYLTPATDRQGRPRKQFWMMKLKPEPPRNLQREFDEQERRAAASDERKRNKTGHQAPRTSQEARQQAEKTDGVKEDETKENDNEL